MQAILHVSSKTLAPIGEKIMYRRSEKQLEFKNFTLPFSGKLSSDDVCAFPQAVSGRCSKPCQRSHRSRGR
ncbi:MAG: hypothetical protein SWO11_23075, partial [Thermodesulfobacteriota bacterium]|nr:hypothetical protein [Thermodesulfobacteriota bacterium]